jgi:hypothetical protein
VLVMLLTRLNQSGLAIYWSVTTRSERKRLQTWKEQIRDW